MKKVSTAAAKQTKNLSDQKLTIGLDVGDRSSWYCVLDEAGEVLLEQKLARAALVRARTSLINTARGLTKSYGERLRGCSRAI